MNKRRKLLVALGAGALAAPFGSFAQQQGKIWRGGFLAPGISFCQDILTDRFLLDV